MTEKNSDEEILPRILVVDDVAENIHMLMAVFENDYHVLPAKSGKAALKKIEKGLAPDLILLDILMPDMDGYVFCKNIKENPATRDIPVIFLTAVSEAMDAAKGFELGAVDFITKPFNPPTVKARVATHLKLSATIRELQKALREIKTLNGLLPICASCKKIRDDKGYWNQIEQYINERTEARFTHGICPECAEKIYPAFTKK